MRIWLHFFVLNCFTQAKAMFFDTSSWYSFNNCPSIWPFTIIGFCPTHTTVVSKLTNPKVSNEENTTTTIEPETNMTISSTVIDSTKGAIENITEDTTNSSPESAISELKAIKTTTDASTSSMNISTLGSNETTTETMAEVTSTEFTTLASEEPLTTDPSTTSTKNDDSTTTEPSTVELNSESTEDPDGKSDEKADEESEEMITEKVDELLTSEETTTIASTSESMLSTKPSKESEESVEYQKTTKSPELSESKKSQTTKSSKIKPDAIGINSSEPQTEKSFRTSDKNKIANVSQVSYYANKERQSAKMNQSIMTKVPKKESIKRPSNKSS